MQFRGQLLLPGDDGPGLSVCLDLAKHHLAVESDSGGLGAWPLEAVDAERLRGDVFALTVAGESLRFVADDTIAFAYSGVPAITSHSGPRRRRSGVRAFINRLLSQPERSRTVSGQAQETTPLASEGWGRAPVPSPDLIVTTPVGVAGGAKAESEEELVARSEPGGGAYWGEDVSQVPSDLIAVLSCPALRADGRRCESTILTSSGYCHPHDPRRAFEDKYRAAKEARAKIRQEATSKLNRIYTRLEKAMRQVERGELDPEIAMAMAQLARTMCAILDGEVAPSAQDDR